MKHYFFLILVLCSCAGYSQSKLKTENIFIITIDGVRWQEMFKGADYKLISNPSYTKDTALSKLEFWDSLLDTRRKKLAPFFWNILYKKGQIYGNRQYRNKVRVANLYKFSYPGYNEILSGATDFKVNSNQPIDNRNENVLEFLNNLPEYKDSVVAFTSWNIFPSILNVKRNNLPVNSGYETLANNSGNNMIDLINEFQDKIVIEKKDTRYDELTFLAAMEYVQHHQPKVAFISFGEADESAHNGEYDSYLRQINNVDRMIARLWYYIQSNPVYKDKTTLLITTDHGRGNAMAKWTDHDIFVAGSGDAWLAIMGPDIDAEGEIKQPQKIYQKQIAGSIAALLGLSFTAEHIVAKPIQFNGVK